jgi:S-formylglutathione hydrolase FrmB
MKRVPSDRGTARGIGAAVATLFVVAVTTACSVSAGAPNATAQPADDGARIVSIQMLDSRTRDLTIESPAVGSVKVRLLVPSDFESSSNQLPMLMLLHGGGGEYPDWTDETAVETYTAAAEVLVAMPDAQSSNIETMTPQPDGTAQRGPHDWEQFHLTELPQLLQRNWRASPVQAVGGLSLGGYSAMMYTARHPGMFAATASFSGVLDITAGTDRPPSVADVIAQVEQTADEANWPDANPIDLVPALHGATLFISYGNGQPGPLDQPGAAPDELEAWVGAGDDNFVQALRTAGISATVDAYGPGTHSWVYWDRELKQALPLILHSLRAGPAPSAGTAAKR